MRKFIAILALATLLISALIVPTSAADRVNVMLNANEPETIFGGKFNSSYIPAMWDGATQYNSDDKLSYCDFKTTAGKADVTAGTAPLYNVMGEEGKADSKYFLVFHVELDKTYEVGGSRVYFQGDNTTANLDGYDLLVSETGAAGSWTVVHSATNMLCDKHFDAVPSDGTVENGTVYNAAEFDKTYKAKYIAIGATQPRCQHADKLVGRTDITADPKPNANTNYFRITEIELFEGAPVAKAPETTAAPATTAAPETTKAPETTAPATTPATADATVIVAGMALMAAALVVISRRRATK